MDAITRAGFGVARANASVVRSAMAQDVAGERSPTPRLDVNTSTRKVAVDIRASWIGQPTVTGSSPDADLVGLPEVKPARKFNPQSYVPYGCPLTASQLETLRLVSEGLAYKEVAVQRRCTVSTVRSHVHQICLRLNVAKCAQAILVAYRKGWLDEHAENQTSVQVRRLAEATEELVVHLQKRKQKMPPALHHYLASFDDLMLARDDDERGAARDLMEQSLTRVLREKGIPRRTARNHNGAFARLLEALLNPEQT